MLKKIVLLIFALALVAGCNTSRLPASSELGEDEENDFSNIDASLLDPHYSESTATTEPLSGLSTARLSGTYEVPAQSAQGVEMDLVLSSNSPVDHPWAPAPTLKRYTSAPMDRWFTNAITHGSRTLLFWSESLRGDLPEIPDQYALSFKELDGDLNVVGGMSGVISNHSHQWGPSAAAFVDAGGKTRSLLAYYHLDNGGKAGDRDISIVEYEGFFHKALGERRITRDTIDSPANPYRSQRKSFDSSGQLGVNHATPSVLVTSDRILVAFSEGFYNPTAFTSGISDGYVEKHILIKSFNHDWTGEKLIQVTAPQAGVKCNLPQLSQRAGRFYVAYTCLRPSFSNYTQVYLKVFDSNWKMLSETNLTHGAEPTGSYEGKIVFRAEEGKDRLYLAYSSNLRGVVVRRLDPATLVSQGEVVVSARLAAPYKTSAPSIFLDGTGKLALTFVATVGFNPASEFVQKDLFLLCF